MLIAHVQGGNAGRWKTAHHKAKVAGKVEMGTTFSVGDEGIWVTFAKGMKFKAVREFRELCEAVRGSNRRGSWFLACLWFNC